MLCLEQMLCLRSVTRIALGHSTLLSLSKDRASEAR